MYMVQRMKMCVWVCGCVSVVWVRACVPCVCVGVGCVGVGVGVHV